ncbi:hypothetical protein G6514_007728 [Epicoccum nigrum]|nr:hypothetical protein G6514_007728 [Epicoccum nigrum]
MLPLHTHEEAMSLPSDEIRNQIYDYVTDNDAIKLSKVDNNVLSERLCNEKTGMLSLGLAHLCRKIRAEFRPLFIARTTFVIRGDDINGFINSIIFPKDTDISTLVARIRIELWLVGDEVFTLDLKPLLQLSQLAEDISVVFKQTVFNQRLKCLMQKEQVQDRTLQELFEEMLGIRDFTMFIGFAEQAIPWITLYAHSSYADTYGQESHIRADTVVISVEVGISDQYWSPLFKCVSY